MSTKTRPNLSCWLGLTIPVVLALAWRSIRLKESHGAMSCEKPKNHKAASFSQDDEIWFCSVPMGKQKLENLLKEIKK